MTTPIQTNPGAVTPWKPNPMYGGYPADFWNNPNLTPEEIYNLHMADESEWERPE